MCVDNSRVVILVWLGSPYISFCKELIYVGSALASSLWTIVR